MQEVGEGLNRKASQAKNTWDLLSMSWTHLSWASRSIIELIRWDIWRNNHWLWLMQNLEGNGTIQEFGWGHVGRDSSL